jgi:excisionase family DNA binding protein
MVQAVPEAVNDLLDVDQVAEKLNCSKRHVYRLSDAGRMPAPVRLGGLVRGSRAAIDEWVSAGCPSCRKGGVR